MLKLGLLILSIFTEIFVSNNYNGLLLSEFSTLLFYSFMVSLLFITQLANFSIKNITVFMLLLVIQSILSSISFYYTNDFNILFSLFGLLLCIGNFLSDVGSKDISIYKKSYFFTNLIENLIFPYIQCYLLFYHLKNILLKNLNEINESVDVPSSSIDILLTFALIESPFILIKLYRKLFSKEKRPESLFFHSVKSLIFITGFFVLFYVNYSKELSETLYSLLMTRISQPYNLVIYNSLPLISDARMKILLLTGLYVKNKLLSKSN